MQEHIFLMSVVNLFTAREIGHFKILKDTASKNKSHFSTNYSQRLINMSQFFKIYNKEIFNTRKSLLQKSENCMLSILIKFMHLAYIKIILLVTTFH